MNLGWEKSKLRCGCGKIRNYGRLVLEWAVLFAAAMVILVGLQPARAVDFWSENQLLFSAFIGSGLLAILGQCVFAWIRREQNRVLKSVHGEWRLPPADSFSFGSRHDATGEGLADAALVQEAREFHKMHFQNPGYLSETCPKIDPIFKMALAREMLCLAAQADVCEDAALLALMKQLEN